MNRGLRNGTDLCGWWRTEFLVSLWDPSSRALSTAVSRRSSMLLSVFSLSWGTTADTQTHAKPWIKKLEFGFSQKKKTHRKYLGNIKSLNCIQFWVAAQTPGVCNSSQSLPLWQGTLRCRYQCTKPKKYTSCLPKFPPNLIFMQNKTQISPSLHATMGKPFFFVIWILLLYPALTVCWPQNIFQYISHCCMKRSTMWSLNGLCD